MNGVATKKVVGGKLLRVKSEFTDVVQSVQLTGDFFLHPEEAVQKIEENLCGLSVKSTPEIFAERVHRALEEHHIQLIGVSPEDVANTLVASFSL